MTVSEVMDLLRAKLGDSHLDPFVLKYILAEGRRELESRGNYYFGTGSKDHALTIGTQSYDIITDLALTRYKNHRSLFIRDAAGTQWLPLEIGSWNSTLDAFTTSPTDKPAMATIDNETLYFFPTPDAAYNIKLLHFNWTDNPTDITDTDELFTNWPQAILYASIMVGRRYLTNGKDQAAEWEDLMEKQVEILKEFTNRRLGEPVNVMSTREAAMILQASGGQPQ